MADSYYDILGVDERANKEEIKKAFRGLSLKHHPDKNPGNPKAVDMFQKISEAYETLGDDSKRQEYDMMRQNPFMRMNGGGSRGNPMDVNMDDMLNSLFGNMGFFPGAPFGNGMPFGPGMPPGMSGGPGIRVFHNGMPMPMPMHMPMGFQQALQKPSPIIKNVIVNIEQILTGAKIPVDIERWIIENGDKIFEAETLYIDIPQGADDNEIIIIRDKGNVVNDDCKGDVKIFVKVTNHTEFKRSGLDLILEKEISLKDALCGFSFELKYINGKSYTLNNNSGNIIKPDYKKIISGMGLKRENHQGNLIIHFNVIYPEKLTEEQIAQLKTIL
jgi:DnaJ-class molecular chaperone